MNFLESCSLYSGLKIKSPKIFDKIYPIPKNKYIVLNTLPGSTGYSYPLWRDVMDSITKKLGEYNISLVLLTDKDVYISPNQVLNININKIKNGHLAFILRNSMLYCGTCLYSCSIASHYGVKSIILKQKEDPKVKRIFDSSKNVTEFVADIKSGINHVKQEDVSNKIFQDLNLEYKLNIETIYQGSMYSDSQIFEITPDQKFGPENFPNIPVNIRFDYNKKITNQELANVFEVLKTRKSALVVSSAFPVLPFHVLRKNIESVTYDVTNGLDLKFLKDLQSLTRNIKIIFFNTGSQKSAEDLKQRKFDLIDFPYIISSIEGNNRDIDLSGSDIFYKSARFIISNNKTYISKSSLDMGLFIEDPSFYSEQDISKLDKEKFKIEDLEFSSIFKKIN